MSFDRAGKWLTAPFPSDDLRAADGTVVAAGGGAASADIACSATSAAVPSVSGTASAVSVPAWSAAGDWRAGVGIAEASITSSATSSCFSATTIFERLLARFSDWEFAAPAQRWGTPFLQGLSSLPLRFHS